MLNKLGIGSVVVLLTLIWAVPANARKPTKKRKVVKTTKTTCKMTCVMVCVNGRNCKTTCKKTRCRKVIITKRIKVIVTTRPATAAKVTSEAVKLDPKKWATLKKFIAAVGKCTYKGVVFGHHKGYVRADGWKQGAINVDHLVANCKPSKLPKFKLDSYLPPRVQLVTGDFKRTTIPPIIKLTKYSKLATPCTLMISGKKWFVRESTALKHNYRLYQFPTTPSYVSRLIKAGFCKPYKKPTPPPSKGLVYTRAPTKPSLMNAKNTIIIHRIRKLPSSRF